MFIRWLWIVVLDYRSSYQAAPQGSEKSCKKRNQSSTDESDTAARHQLLHALALCARIVIAVTLHEVHDTPDRKTCAKCDNKSLKNANCACEKCHNVIFQNRRLLFYCSKCIFKTKKKKKKSLILFISQCSFYCDFGSSFRE